MQFADKKSEKEFEDWFQNLVEAVSKIEDNNDNKELSGYIKFAKMLMSLKPVSKYGANSSSNPTKTVMLPSNVAKVLGFAPSRAKMQAEADDSEIEDLQSEVDELTAKAQVIMKKIKKLKK